MAKSTKFFLIALFLSLPVWWKVEIKLEDFFYAQISQPLENLTFVKIPEKPKLELQVKSAISMRISPTGRQKILFRKNSEEILPIASLTKLMTAEIVLGDPQNYDFYKMVKISKTAALQDDAPIYGNLIAGTKESVENLLDLMLIYSSNDAAFTLSEVIGTEDFVEKMNQRAEELGLEKTHFINPTGLDPENYHFNSENLNNFNYSTAQDLAELTKYIIKNQPLIFEISLRKGPYLVENGISNLTLPDNFEIAGGKTGYTDEAGGCMILILKNEREVVFINIILGASTLKDRVLEMEKLVNWLTL